MGTQLSSSKGGQPSIFGPYPLWPMPLGAGVGLSPGDFVTGTQLPSPKRGRSPPIFDPCLLWPSDWMKTLLGTEVGLDLGPGHIVLDEDPALSAKGAQQPPPLFSALVYCGHGR